MKRLDEFSRDELVSLTQEEIQDLIDLECMYNGKPLMIEEPKYLEVPEVPEMDVVTYEVAGHIFTNKSDAMNVKDLIENAHSRIKLDYNNCDYSQKYVRKILDSDYEKTVSLKTGKAYSREQFSQIKVILAKIKEIKDANDEAKKSYDDIVEERKDIVSMVNDEISNAINETYEIDKAVVAFERYFKLSNEDTDIAMNFFEESVYGKYIEEVKDKLSLK